MVQFDYDPSTGLITLSEVIGGERIKEIERRYIEKGLTKKQFFDRLIEAVKATPEEVTLRDIN
jgi:hypothetical protein